MPPEPETTTLADEVTSPQLDTKRDVSSAKKGADDSATNAQLDGAGPWSMGSAGLDESEFDVNIQLFDLQDDPNNPLYSAKTFQELNL